jgi:hypothetical protein
MLDFAAQPVYMNVDYVGVWLNAHSPHVIEDHRSCDDPARIPAEVLEKNELLWRQIEYLPVARRLPS